MAPTTPLEHPSHRWGKHRGATLPALGERTGAPRGQRSGQYRTRTAIIRVGRGDARLDTDSSTMGDVMSWGILGGEDVTLRCGDATLQAVLGRPAAPGRYPAVIVFHGTSGLGAGM